jgi:DNA repair protein RecO (recombination protein O)
MLHQTEGIVIRNIPYRETSVICTIFTEKFGKQSYIVNGVRSAKSTTKTLLQPLSLLDLIVYKRANVNLERIKEFKSLQLYSRIPFEPIRQTITFFICELLQKSLTEDLEDQTLYQYIKQALLHLDKEDCETGTYPIQFMFELSQYLGFGPQGEQIDNCICFDLRQGIFSLELPPYAEFLVGDDLLAFKKLWLDSPGKWNMHERRKILALLERYYQLHISGFGSLKTPQVLQGLF